MTEKIPKSLYLNPEIKHNVLDGIDRFYVNFDLALNPAQYVRLIELLDAGCINNEDLDYIINGDLK